MLSHLIHDGKEAVASWSRSAGLAALAGLLMLPAAGLLTHAAWLTMAVTYGPVLASLALGLAYAGLAIVVFAFAATRPKPKLATLETLAQGAPGQALLSSMGFRRQDTALYAGLLEAFILGVQLARPSVRRLH